jgi:hypothetical protein
MSEHFIEICSVCGVVISQCRCADKNKNIRHSLCDKCKNELPKRELPDYSRGWREGYAAGCREQARAMKEAVIKYTDECHYKNPDGIAMCIELPALFAALAAAEIKPK